MTDISESILMSIPMLDSVFPQLTNQQFYQLRLPRETALYSALPFVLPYSADQIDRRFSNKDKDKDKEKDKDKDKDKNRQHTLGVVGAGCDERGQTCSVLR